MVRRQSAADRQKRLDEGRCPIHGIGLCQIDSWYEEADWPKRRTLGKHYTLVTDGRNDCPLVIKAYDSDGPWEVLPEWEHILDGESDDDLVPREDLARREVFLNPDLMEEAYDAEAPLRSSMLIQWSDADRAYHVTLPEWEGRVTNPVASAKSYSEAAHEGYFALRWLAEQET